MNDKPIGLILSKRTESLRLYLLIVSFIDILVINVGLFPKEINTFSIKIDHIDYSSFLILILLLTSFFTITFGFFASVDWMNYKLLLSADDTINDWEKRKIDLSKDKYEQAINEFRVSLKQGIGRIQEQIRKMDFIFHLPPDHSFYSMKKKVKKYLHIAKIFQFVLPIFEIIVPLALGIYSFIMIICELINK